MLPKRLIPPAGGCTPYGVSQHRGCYFSRSAEMDSKCEEASVPIMALVPHFLELYQTYEVRSFGEKRPLQQETSRLPTISSTVSRLKVSVYKGFLEHSCQLSGGSF